MRQRIDGFTLVELFAVISIIALLAAILLPVTHIARQHGRVQKAAAEIIVLRTALAQYHAVYGDYPPSSLDELDMPGSAVNDGNEAMTACLATTVGEGPFLYPWGPKDRRFKNQDQDIGDPSKTQWVFADDALREFVDPWDSPYIYFHGRQLRDGVAATYRFRGAEVVVSPVKDPETGTYHSAQSYQLWSIGPNGFNDEGEKDDLANWTVATR